MVSAQGKRIWFAPFVDVVVGLKQLLRGYVHNFVNHTRQEYAYGEVGLDHGVGHPLRFGLARRPLRRTERSRGDVD